MRRREDRDHEGDAGRRGIERGQVGKLVREIEYLHRQGTGRSAVALPDHEVAGLLIDDQQHVAGAAAVQTRCTLIALADDSDSPRAVGGAVGVPELERQVVSPALHKEHAGAVLDPLRGRNPRSRAVVGPGTEQDPGARRSPVAHPQRLGTAPAAHRVERPRRRGKAQTEAALLQRSTAVGHFLRPLGRSVRPEEPPRMVARLSGQEQVRADPDELRRCRARARRSDGREIGDEARFRDRRRHGWAETDQSHESRLS